MSTAYHALTRELNADIVDCELTHLTRQPIDFERASEQHRRYQRALEDLGCVVQQLAAAAGMPDAVFVEDQAVVLDECALLTRSGAPSRRGERASIEAALQPHRIVHAISAPGTLDGGDVIVVGRRVFAGASTRSNSAGLEQLCRLVESFGYTFHQVPVRGCLHLKSAASAVAADTLLVRSDWADASLWPGVRLLVAAADEPECANAVRVGGAVLHAHDCPQTAATLRYAGIEVHPLDLSELRKAEGALTCCSLVFTL